MATTRREQAQVLNPQRATQRMNIGRKDPPDELAWCVDYLWWVHWDAPVAYTQHLIPRPVVHVAAELSNGEPRLLVTGVATRLFERTLEGVGRTVAAAFRPGGLRPFLGSGVASFNDRVVPADDVFGIDDRPLARRLLDASVSEEDAAAELAAWLMSVRPEHDPVVGLVADLVERVEADRTIVRAGQLADLAHVSSRTLQRWFQAYVGLSPKAVVQRHRLLDVAAMANSGDDVNWASLASELGYTDQSHLIRHFTAMVGQSPARYAGRSLSAR